jgi:hypothetical protein
MNINGFRRASLADRMDRARIATVAYRFLGPELSVHVRMLWTSTCLVRQRNPGSTVSPNLFDVGRRPKRRFPGRAAYYDFRRGTTLRGAEAVGLVVTKQIMIQTNNVKSTTAAASIHVDRASRLHILR